MEVRDLIAQDAATIPDDALDGYALELEKVLAADAGLRALANQTVEIASTDSELLKDVGSKPLALLRQIWAVTYRVDPTDPSVRR